MELTINQLKAWDACGEGYNKVIAALGKDFDRDAPIKLLDILNHETSTVEDVLWCVGEMELTPEQERDFRLFACGCAERVLPIFEKERPDDKRPRECIEVARHYANGDATEEQRAAARAAARDAARDAAGDAARDAARDAAGAAARDAARAAARAAARDAARDAAGAAERDNQKQDLRKILERY